MKLVDHLIKRSIYERVFHAVTYEVVAILTSTPLMAWIMDKPMLQMGVLSILVSLTAMIWNVIFNFIFDQLQVRFKFQRTFWVRLIHGTGFEVGLILFSVPLAAAWLDIPLLKAFFLEAGMLLYFFPYTVIFNWIYDHLKALFIRLLLKQSSSGGC